MSDWRIGDQVRTRAARYHHKPAGAVGTVVAVADKATAATFALRTRALALVYLVDFGPDENAPNGRDTWGYADIELEAADAPPKGRKRKAKDKG